MGAFEANDTPLRRNANIYDHLGDSNNVKCSICVVRFCGSAVNCVSTWPEQNNRLEKCIQANTKIYESGSQ